MSVSLPDHVRALLHAAIFPHDTDNITLIETHISWVILTGPYAYKLKKPHDLGFLNFSTLKLRKRFCEMELRLNRRLAPDMYLEVLPIRKHGPTFILGGEADEIIDYCVKMRQFDQSALLNEQIQRPDFDPSCMDELAACIAAFHASFPASGDSCHAGSPEILLQHIIDNLNIGRALPWPDEQKIIRQLEQMSRQAILDLSPELRHRQEAGHIRECHGDLHLKNIALIDGRPIVFDCIEFNDDYRIIDVMSDVAFLFMDCDARQRPELGFRFLSRYLEHCCDYDGLRLLSLYASYRAGVRGKVSCLLAQEPGLNTSDRQQQLSDAQDYFRLALAYNTEKTPSLFAVGGLSGSGKSHLALKGCGPERAIIIRSDANRKRLALNHPDLPLYGKAMNDLTYKALFDAAAQVIAAGYSVILDATFLNMEFRQKVREFAKKNRTPARFFWLDIPENELRRRLAARQQLGHDISDADLEVLDMQLMHYNRPTEAGMEFLSSSDDWPARG
ncbi:MAG TPA: AAA family ATPase [Mariprofundaceae bacterium]|nr:AAA family ATPase [Mariprofundaceae bacterium]